MAQQPYFLMIRNVAISCCATVSLSACLSSNEGDVAFTDNVVSESRISGSVGDGPVAGASMRVLSNGGSELLAFQSDLRASYDVVVNAAGNDYPLSVTANGGTDLVTNLAPDFELRGAVLRPSDQSVANVNPFSTVAVLLAQEMAGGVTDANLRAAQSIVSTELNSGLGSLAASGPMTTRIDENNIAEIVRASEALSEVIRRTRDLMTGAGFPTNADQVMATVASDLTDEVLDGQGGSNADPRTAAIATIVYAQVLVEVLANQLYVNGSDATSAMEGAINQVSAQAPSRTLDDLVATSEMLERARVGIAAAFAVDNRSQLADLHAAVSGMQPGMDRQLARSLLPSDYRTAMDSTIANVASADVATINMINSIAQGDGDIASGNRAPTIQGEPATSVEVGSDYAFSPTASDADGDSLTFTISNQPSWASFDSSAGRLSGTPSAGDVGTYDNIVISVSDGEFTDNLTAFSIEVFQGNAAPTISGSPTTRAIAGRSYVFQPMASDPNGDDLTFSIDNRPSWASFNASTGRLSGTPSESDVGSYADITISVSDGALSDSLPPFNITVEAAPASNTPPQISGNPSTQVTAGNSYSFTPTASDADGDSLSFSISNRPSWATFNASTGRLRGTPSAGDVGTYSNIVISVSDGALSDSLPPFSITVEAAPAVNTAPQISGNPPTQVAVGNSYSFTPTASDADGDSLTFSISNRPSWATLNTSTGRLRGTPSAADVGTYGNIVISVSDGALSDSLPPFSVTVEAAPASNTPPQISGNPSTRVTVGNNYAFTPTASDADGDSLTFSISNRPSWASFNASTGRLSGTPSAADAGSYGNIVISVSDGALSDSLSPFTITVEAAPNTPPEISGNPSTQVTVGNNYSFTPAASDADGDTLTFSISNRPSWATFNTSSGRLRGTPSAGDVGSYGNIVISVSDGAMSDSLPPFSITVEAAPNTPPQISGNPPAEVNAGSSYSFTPTASDADGDNLTFSISNRPSWATFNASTGRLSGTPGDGDVGTYSNIRITVSDGTDSTSLQFSVSVNAVSLGSVTLTWTAPTRNDDGTQLTDLAGYKIYWGTTPGNYTDSVTLNNPSITTYVVENLAPGTYEFVARSFNSSGVESTNSNTASVTVN